MFVKIFKTIKQYWYIYREINKINFPLLVLFWKKYLHFDIKLSFIYTNI